MSRSRRKQPYFYMCSCKPTIYKTMVNREMRRTVRTAIHNGVEEDDLPKKLDEVIDIWCAPMDGKKRWSDPKGEWAKKMMRKK
jgi:hypothetical protein